MLRGYSNVTTNTEIRARCCKLRQSLEARRAKEMPQEHGILS